MQPQTEQSQNKRSGFWNGALVVILLIVLCYPLLFLFAPVSVLKFILYPLWSMIDALTIMVIGMTAADVWLARGIAIALYSLISFFCVGVIGNFVGVHKYLFKRERRLAVVLVGCATCLAMYFVSRGVHFSPVTGEPLKKYYRHADGKIDLFPIEMNFHPLYGDTLKPATREILVALAERNVTKKVEPRATKIESVSPPQPEMVQKVPIKPNPVAKTVLREPRTVPDKPEKKLIEPGLVVTLKNKKLKIWIPPNCEIVAKSVEIMSDMKVRIELTIENLIAETIWLRLAEPETYAFITDQSGKKYSFHSSEGFPETIPAGVPLRFTLTFAQVPSTTSTLFLSFRCVRLGSPQYRRKNWEPDPSTGKDIVLRELGLDLL